MKTVKINFCGFWGSFKKDDNLFTRILQKRYKVEISDNPDFLICSNRGSAFEYMNYDCTRIMFMGENISPDFTVFDYCIGFDYLDFDDRYFRLPFAFYFDNAKPWVPQPLSYEKAKEISDAKKYFCNFVYGHRSSHGMREKLFETLCEYKRVESPGSFMNNTSSDKKRCSWAEKNEYLVASKFTIACDSIAYPGFCTEKIVQPFIQHSVPVYFGNPKIDDYFNTDAFVWCKNESDLDRTLEEVRYLDQNEGAYIEKLMLSPLRDVNLIADLYNNLESFLYNIFDQSPEESIRRVRFFCAERHESFLRDYAKKYKNTPDFIKKIKGLE